MTTSPQDARVSLASAELLLPDELRAKLPMLSLLTAREAFILQMLAIGLDNHAIARHLGISQSTVKTHMTALLAKLGVRSRLQAGLIAFAARLDGRFDIDLALPESQGRGHGARPTVPVS